MAVTVKRINLWRKELENKAGTLAGTLEPLAKAGADLQIVMGYKYPGESAKAAVELYPVASKKITQAAQSAGLAASGIPVVLVGGDNRPGLGHRITQAIADAGVNVDFMVANVIGRKYSAVIGFENDADADKATELIKKNAGKKK
ncbi:MAG: ACT domain-containing protein [Candidatus Acidiferrum sp.]